MKFIAKIIELIYWLQLFISPTALLGFIGFLLYNVMKNQAGLYLFFALLATGAIIGFYFAERIRRREGCSIFMGRIFGSGNNNS
jgi:hypothetical protein